MSRKYRCPIEIYEEHVDEWKFVAHTSNLDNPYERVQTYHWAPLLEWFIENCEPEQYKLYVNNETYNYHFRFEDVRIATLLKLLWERND